MSESLNFDKICELIPHRPPFLMVDRVLKLDINSYIHAIKCVSALEPFFPGHFPGNPVFPGVLMLEGMAQSSGILMFKSFMERGDLVEPKTILTGIDEVRFRRQIVPGDVMHYHVRYERGRGTFLWFSGEVRVDGELACEAKFSAIFTRVQQENAAKGAPKAEGS